MIAFNGISFNNKMAYLSFINELGEKVSIPIDLVIADRITKYLSKITLSPTEILKRNNDESEDVE